MGDGGRIVKLTRPRSESALTRTRLFRMLDKTRKNHVVWVCAPPGAGKTTLVSSYIAARRLPSLWYTLDPADADIATLFHFLAQAVPRRGEPLPPPTADRRTSMALFTRQFFTALCARLPAGAVLVFDNHHELANDRAFGEVMRTAIASLRGGQRIVILSRLPPPPDLVAAEVGRQLVQIREVDLRLTLAETQSLARRRRVTISAKALRLLHERTHGWVAGLVWFLETGQHGALETPAVLRDFIAREHLDQLPASTRQLLVRVALPRRISAAMATALAGRRAGTALTELARRGSFVSHRLGPSWELHPLLRELLIDRAVDELGADEVGELRLIAAKQCVAENELDDAAELYANGGCGPELAALISQAAPMLLAQGRDATLERWLAQVPAALRSSPALKLWQGHCDLHRDPVAAREHFIAAFEGFRAAGDRVGQFFAWPGVVMSIVASSDDLRPVDRWIEALDQLGDNSRGLVEAGPHVLMGLVFAVNLRSPDHPRAREWAASALRLLELATAEPGALMMLGGQLVEHALLFGEPALAARVMELLRKLPASGAIQAKIGFLHVESLVALQHAQLTRSLDKAEAGIALARNAGLPRTLIHATAARAALIAGALDQASAHLAEMKAGSPPGSRLHTAHHAYLDAWSALLAGNAERATERGILATQLSHEVGAVFPEAYCRLVLAEAHAERGAAAAAFEELVRVRAIASRTTSRALEVHALATSAHLAHLAGDRSLAVETFGTALAIARTHGVSLLATWSARRTTIQALSLAALDADIETETACTLLHVVGGDFAPPASLDRWPWPVRIRMCGGFKLELADRGKPQRRGKKIAHRPLELLQLLVALGGRDVSETTLYDTMWPDADGDRAKKTFEITLHRLRSMLGDPTLVRREQGLVTLDRARMFADVWAIDDLLRPVPATTKAAESAAALSRLERARALHVGPLLPENRSPWVQRARAELASKLARAGARLR